MTSYERLLRNGWVNVDGPNPTGDHYNDGRAFIFVMHHPERNKYHARIEATNIRDTCFEVIRDTMQEAIDACLNSRHIVKS